MRWLPCVIYTFGHSTREFAEFLRLLQSHGVRGVVDVRRYPASRRHPQFTGAALAQALRAVGLAYTHEVDLGGRREPRTDSPNTAWRSLSFRGYADYMDSEPFQAALQRVITLARQSTIAVMCAEAVPWRCHRQLIADALVSRGHEVRHILSVERADVHRLSPFAQILPDGLLRYAGAPEQLDLSGQGDGAR